MINEKKKYYPKLISYIFLSFSILLFTYILFKAEYFHHGNKFDYYFKYYLISVFFIIFSILSFLINKKLKYNIFLIFLSIILILYLIEAAILINKNLPVSIPGDERSHYQVYLDLKKEGKNPVLENYPSMFFDNNDKDIIPFSSISNRTTILGNENGYYKIYYSDRHGFNNPNNEWNKKFTDFLIIGGQFAHGCCVKEKNTIGGFLREKNNNKNVLNLGYIGNGPLTSYAILKEYLPYIKAKRVLWIYFERNDLKNLNSEIKKNILLNYLKDNSFSQNLYHKQKEVDLKLHKILEKQEEKYKIKKNKSFNFKKLTKFLKVFYVRYYTLEKLFPQKNPIQEFSQILLLSKKFVNENDAKLYFVYLPSIERYLNKSDTAKDFHDYQKVIEVIKNLNIPIINIDEDLFKKHKDPLSLFTFRRHGHYTDVGFRKVAETILTETVKIEK